MEQITLGQVALGLTFICGLLGSIKYLRGHLKEWISGSLVDQFNTIDDKFDGLTEQINGVDMNATKNFLVAFLGDLEKGNWFDEIETERFWEQYQHYCKIGGNSYIQRKVEQLKEEGKL